MRCLLNMNNNKKRTETKYKYILEEKRTERNLLTKRICAYLQKLY